MSPNSQPSTVTALFIIGLVIVATALVAIFALTCARSSTEYSFQHRGSSSITANFSRTRNRRRHLIRFDEGSPFISPSHESHPTIFGDAKDAECLVKLVLTPPTPARRERRASLVNPDDEDRI